MNWEDSLKTLPTAIGNLSGFFYVAHQLNWPGPRFSPRRSPELGEDVIQETALGTAASSWIITAWTKLVSLLLIGQPLVRPRTATSRRIRRFARRGERPPTQRGCNAGLSHQGPLSHGHGHGRRTAGLPQRNFRCMY